VNCIIQDRKGFLWFGTQDGLNKFDGYTFTVFKHDPLDSNSLSDNFIWAMTEDHAGKLWIGTSGAGLNCFDPETESFTRYSYLPSRPNGISSNEVLAITEDRSGVLWIGTRGGGLNTLDPMRTAFTVHQTVPGNSSSISDNNVYGIVQDSSGTIWIGTRGGLNRWNSADRTFTRFVNDPKRNESLSDNNIRTLFVDSRNTLWIGTESGGLNRFDQRTGTFQRYMNDPSNNRSIAHNSILSISEDEDGALWIGTLGGGLERFSGGEFFHHTHNPQNPKSLGSNRVYSLFSDRTQILWVGTGGSGISKFNPITKKFLHFSNSPGNDNSLSHNSIWNFCEETGSNGSSVWVATLGGGVNKFNRTTGTFRAYAVRQDKGQTLNDNDIWCLMQDHDGILWIGTYGGGLNKFDPVRNTFEHFTAKDDDPGSIAGNDVITIVEYPAGTLWIGTNNGLSVLQKNQKKFIRIQHSPNDPSSLNHNAIRAMFVDHHGALWVGTDRGLNVLSPDQTAAPRRSVRFTHITADKSNVNGLSDNRIRYLYEDSGGTVWIGTRGGLNEYDPATQRITRYTDKDGLPNNVIYGIVADNEGYLWISTNFGLSRFDRKNRSFRNYDVNDGLQSNEFNQGACMRSSTGELYFGGTNGFNCFFPDRITDNPHVPPIVLTDFKIFDKRKRLERSISSTNGIVLNYDDDFFSFEFSALDFSHPEKNQYAYQLVGFDKDWIYSGTRRYASYTSLDGGTYTFRVKGSNNDGVWNEQGASINITITSPLWKSWWAYALYLVLVIGSVFALIRWRTQKHITQLQAQEKELEHDRLLLKNLQAEQTLRKSEAKYQEIFDESEDVIFISTPDGEFVDVNPAGVKLFGYSSKEEMIGSVSSHDLFLNANDRTAFRTELETKGFVKNKELVLKRKDGKQIIVMETSTVVRDDHGTVQYYRGIIRDITDQKHLEQQLIQVQKLDSLGRLAGGVAHDFNNVLTMITGAAQVMMPLAAHDEKLSRYAKMIVEASQRGASISKQLLLFARSEKLELKPISLSHIVGEVKQLLDHTLPKSVTVVTQVTAEEALIMGESAHLHQVLVNLSINAKDAMPNGGTITIGIHTVTKEQIQNKYPSIADDRFVALSVRDTGVGIKMETQQKIFEPFFSTKERGKGAGLGLAIVHGIVQSHRGFIDVESEEGKGTVFTIYFPAISSRAIYQEVPRNGETPHGDETILVVDDEAVIRELLGEMLAEHGYTVMSASNGVEALAAYKAHGAEIDLVISDLGMPTMGGNELFLHLKKLNSDIKLILASGYLEHSSKTEMRENGVKRVITKPFNIDDVLTTIREVLDEP
jgi:PAS domain S-box-containing protein